MDDLTFTVLGNTATHLPQGLGGLADMTALATSKLRRPIAELDVPAIPDLLFI